MELKFNNIVSPDYLMKLNRMEFYNYLINKKIFIHNEHEFTIFKGKLEFRINPNVHRTINIDNLVTLFNAYNYVLNPELQKEIIADFNNSSEIYEKINLDEIKKELDHKLNNYPKAKRVNYLEETQITLYDTIKKKSENDYFELEYPLDDKDLNTHLSNIISANIEIVLQYICGETYIYKGDNLFNNWLSLIVNLRYFQYVKNKILKEVKSERSLSISKKKGNKSYLKVFKDEFSFELFNYLFEEYKENKYIKTVLSRIYTRFSEMKFIHCYFQEYNTFLKGSKYSTGLSKIFDNKENYRQKLLDKQIKSFIDSYIKDNKGKE